MLAWRTDNMVAGGATWAYGKQQPTAGGLGIAALTGMSPENAELTYSLFGVAPVAVQAYLLNKSINVQSAADAWARGTYSVGVGVDFDGRVFRFSDPRFAQSTWDIHPGNVSANHRYSGPGVGSIYSGTTVDTAAAEVGSYRVWGDAIAPRVLVGGNVQVAGVLDLTNPAALRALGVTREQITRSSHGVSGSYDLTQRIARWARDQGYNAILAPSAQNRTGVNLITFDSTRVTNVKYTHPSTNP